MSELDALKSRRVAKAKFTRKKNDFYGTIAKKESIEIIEGKYKELTKAWHEVEGKHDYYITLLDDEDSQEKEEPWINELQEHYSDAVSTYNKCASENLMRIKGDEMRIKFDGLVKKRASLEAMFKTSIEQITKLLSADSKEIYTTAKLKRSERDLTTTFQNCKILHDNIIELPLEQRHIESEIDWLQNLHAQYAEISGQIESHTEAATTNSCIKVTNALQMEKAKMPSFDGDIRNYPRFKSDFTKYVLPTINETNAPFILRSCLNGEPLECIKSVDDDLDEMWTRLDSKFGDPTKITDVVINSIQNFKQIKEGENRKLLEFITVVEDGYRDLKRLGLEMEITTTSSVSIIERKLPNDIKKEWSKIICSNTDPIDQSKKFPSLLAFLLEQRKIIEYETAELRTTNQVIKGSNHYTTTVQTEQTESKRFINPSNNSSKCLIHERGAHWTSECRTFLGKSIDERKQLLKDKGACWACLKPGHRIREFKRRNPCGKNNCTGRHHPTIHEDKPIKESTINETASGSANACHTAKEYTCLFQIQNIPTRRGNVNVMWDSAASLCFITNEKAKAEKLRGETVELSITKIGGETEKIQSHKYNLPLIDNEGNELDFEVYGIDKITNDIQNIDVNGIAKLFTNVSTKEIERPSGTVDVLIGYQYAAYHPQKEEENGQLLLLKNRFGKCIGGGHHVHKTYVSSFKTFETAHIHSVNNITISDFYEIENLGIQCNPRCGSCKCGKCAIGTKNYTLQEERELQLIRKNLEYDEQNKRWIAEYPWIRDPTDLPDNKRVAIAKLLSTEKRLAKNPTHAKVYDLQIQDMLDRHVARKLTKDELQTYKGPFHYIAHHEVLKPDSKTTPVRIVFNSSANYMGHTLNEYWAKGPDLLNSLLGILIRFRENEVAFIGDVRKMYHTVYTKEIDQHTHRFLWRNMNTSKDPDTYVIQRVSFGDKPSGAIATIALRQKAELNQDEFPEATKIIKENSYMDDIIDSTTTKEKALQLTNQIERILEKGGFKMKEWIYSKEPSTQDGDISVISSEKVLGITWNPGEDKFDFKVKLNLTPKKKKKPNKQLVRAENISASIPTTLSKRAILSQVNSIYDPLGIAGPYTVRAKILMRQLWIQEPKLGWDDPIPQSYQHKWTKFFNDMLDMNSVKSKRCIKPENNEGDPSLVIFSDGSKEAYGACAYIRWKLKDGGFDCQLLLSKNRLAPIKKMSIDRIELCAAVINKRLKKIITNECRYNFERTYHFVDSQIVNAMIRKETYGFNTFAATRVGEIQEGTKIDDWYWIPGEHNIADWLTRDKIEPKDINLESIWQKGPEFLRKSENEWPINQNIANELQLPDTIKTTSVNIVEQERKISDTLITRINIHKYSSYTKLLRVTARILAMYKNKPITSFKNATHRLNFEDVQKAEHFWIKEIQREMKKDIEKGRYKRLCPRQRKDGIYVVGQRVQMNYNNNEFMLLPYNHRFSRLYVEYIHSMGHHGIASTASKVRAKFWIIKLHKLVKSIKSRCVTCRKNEKKTNEQIMGQLPEERLKPAPAWHSTAIDLFGPFKIRDEVKKRTYGKAYGIIFNCLASRAVHVDVAPDYSTEKFLMALRRFVALRGYPFKLYSDNGSQLVSANNELANMMKNWSQKDLEAFGVVEGFQWNFTSADAPWQNGISEALVKTIKRALTLSIGSSILTFSELQTVCFEAANLVNERPIGRHPTSPDDGTYLSPNDLLLGRSSSKIPSGPFRETSKLCHRFEFVQGIIDQFWRKWTIDYFPSLIIRQKWHTATRNVREGDIVLIADSNLVRGQWKMARVTKTFPGKDGNVRKVELQYKNARPGEKIKEYKGHGYVTVDRPVHKLVIVVPVEEQNSE